MLTGGVAYRQKPSLFMTVTPGGIKESLLFGQLHSGYTFPESGPGYGASPAGLWHQCDAPLCMWHSGKIVAKLIVNDDIFPDGFTTTVICSDQNLNQNELQQ